MSSKLFGEGDNGVEKLSQISWRAAEDLGALKRVGFFEVAPTRASIENPS